MKAYFAYVEFAGEEQLSITEFYRADSRNYKSCRTRRKTFEAPTAYRSYVEVVRMAATK